MIPFVQQSAVWHQAWMEYQELSLIGSRTLKFGLAQPVELKQMSAFTVYRVVAIHMLMQCVR